MFPRCPPPPSRAQYLDWKAPLLSPAACPPLSPQQGSFWPRGEGQAPAAGPAAGPPGMGFGGPTGSLSRAVCAPHEFQCGNRSCLAAVFVCDGDDDCGDGSDERGCADPACGPREFRCADGSACVPERWLCDRQFDCQDLSDEAAELCGRARPGNATAPAACAAAHFACRSGECVHLGWRCDGDRDCKDQSDEADCRKRPPPPSPLGCAAARPPGAPACRYRPAPRWRAQAELEFTWLLSCGAQV